MMKIIKNKKQKKKFYLVLLGLKLVNIPQRKTALDKEIRDSFNKANEKLEGMIYYPAVLLAHKSSKNYAILAYGEKEDQSSSKGVFLLTLNTNKAEIAGYAYIDLSEYGV